MPKQNVVAALVRQTRAGWMIVLGLLLGLALDTARAQEQNAKPQPPAAAAPAAGEAMDARPGEIERWYTLLINGQKAGGSRTGERQEGKDAAARIITTSDTTIGLGRADTPIKVRMESEFVETAAGKPVSMKTVRTLGAQPVTRTLTFGEKDIKVVTLTGATKSEATVALPAGEWLTPAAAERFVTQRLRSGAKTIEVRSLDPETGTQVITTTRSNIEKTTLTVRGREIPVYKSTLKLSHQPVTGTEWVDEQGVLVKLELNVGGMTMTTLAADRAEAGVAAKPPEIMFNTFVTPDRPISEARGTTKAVYVISTRGDKLEDVPSTAAQKFERIDATSGRLTVDLALGEAKTEDGAAYRGPTPYIQSDDDRIKKLAAGALRGLPADATGAQKAERLRRFVYSHIKDKNLGVGFATAAEVAETRAGDCTEHGVLLAALLRAADIPARVATGMVYADQFAGREKIFGYHMWAQALIEVDGVRKWVDFDGTLPGDTRSDATHIALAVSALADGEMERAMLSLAGSLGQLDIKVESVEHGTKK